MIRNTMIGRSNLKIKMNYLIFSIIIFVIWNSSYYLYTFKWKQCMYFANNTTQHNIHFNHTISAILTILHETLPFRFPTGPLYNDLLVETWDTCVCATGWFVSAGIVVSICIMICTWLFCISRLSPVTQF